MFNVYLFYKGEPFQRAIGVDTRLDAHTWMFSKTNELEAQGISADVIERDYAFKVVPVEYQILEAARLEVSLEMC